MDIIKLVSMVSMLVLVGCGGDQNHDSTKYPNSELTGSLFIGDPQAGPLVLDLLTGHYRAISGVEWVEYGDEYPLAYKFSAFPSITGEEFVETIQGCDYIGYHTFSDCMLIHNSSGELVTRIDVPNEALGPAKISTDGMFIAISVQNTYYDGLDFITEPKQVRIYTRDGFLVDSSSQEIGHGGFDWLPDGRLIFAYGQSLYITQDTSAQGELVMTFAQSEGVPDQLSVSPDGRHLALTLLTYNENEIENAYVYVIDLESLEYVRLASLPESDLQARGPAIMFPTWSPDGKQIAVVLDKDISNACATEQEECTSLLYVVPSDGEDVMLTLETSTQAIPVYTYFQETLEDSNPGLFAEAEFKFKAIRHGGLRWLQ